MSSLPAQDPHRFLFVLWEGGGNSPMQLELARRLSQRGHGVRVLTEEALADDVREAGCRFEPFVEAPNRASRDEDLVRDWEARTPLGAFARARDRVIMGPAAAYARDTRAALGREPVDAVVSDYMLFGVPIATEAAGVPVAVLVHNVYLVPEPGKPAPGPGFLPARGAAGRARDVIFSRAFLRLFNSGLPAVNRARAEHGLEPLDHTLDQLQHVDRVLVLTSESFDFHGTGHPSHVRYVGPVLADPSWVEDREPPAAAGDGRPRVVVSLSSTYMAQERVLARVIDALQAAPVTGVVTTGPAIDPSSLPAAPNLEVVRSAPHGRLFGEADVVVTHAGMGTVTRALCCGAPLVCLPMGRDQLDVAARVVHAGAGVRLRPSARPSAIRRAVERVAGDPGFRAAARELGARMRADAESGRAVYELEALASGARSRR